jgi:hypothetical protein
MSRSNEEVATQGHSNLDIRLPQSSRSKKNLQSIDTSSYEDFLGSQELTASSTIRKPVHFLQSLYSSSHIA